MAEKLPILGAGQYGTVLKEIAEESGKFDEIAFLDDSYGKENSNYHEESIGKITDLAEFTNEYKYAIAAVGNAEVRMSLIEKAESLNFTIPRLVSTRAYVSKSAKLENGVVVEPMATVHANALVCKGSYISAGAVVNHNSVVSSGCHVDNNAVVMSGAVLGPNKTTKPCEVILRDCGSNAPKFDKSKQWVQDYIKENGHEPTFF